MNALQALDGLRAHPVLHQDFGLQHEVLQCGRSERLALRLLPPPLLFFSVVAKRDAMTWKRRSSILPRSGLQTSPVPRLVGIHFRRPVHKLAGLLVIVFRAIEIEEFQQHLRVVGFHGFEALKSSPRNSSISAEGRCDPNVPAWLRETIAVPRAGRRKASQFPRQGHRFRIQLRVHHLSNQGHHLMDARGVCSNMCQISGSLSTQRSAPANACA